MSFSSQTKFFKLAIKVCCHVKWLSQTSSCKQTWVLQSFPWQQDAQNISDLQVFLFENKLGQTVKNARVNLVRLHSKSKQPWWINYPVVSMCHYKKPRKTVPVTGHWLLKLSCLTRTYQVWVIHDQQVFLPIKMQVISGFLFQKMLLQSMYMYKFSLEKSRFLCISICYQVDILNLKPCEHYACN